MRTLARLPVLACILAVPLFLSAQAPAPPDPQPDGDSFWAAGLFDEAEHAYGRAVAANGADARAHHGRARILASRGQLDAALAEALSAVELSPADAEIHHTAGFIYQRQRRFRDASREYTAYLNLLSRRDRSIRGTWTRAEIRFLNSFDGRAPMEIAGSQQSWTVPIRIEHEKVLVTVRINGGRSSEFVLDTGAEQTVVSRDVARRTGVVPITYMQTAGVGDAGLRGLQIGRIDRLEVGGLKVSNVPCVIKNPPLGALPTREPESFSPVALGLSMRVDYARRELTMARSLPASFVVDTGGEVISISDATAGLIKPDVPYRRIPLKVYGASGWDRDAFLMPNVDLEFESIRFSRIPVVVLNLSAPSELLGFRLGGIVGHKFLSKYRVSIDLARSVVGLDSGG